MARFFDLALILSLVVLGMFFPLFFALWVVFGFDLVLVGKVFSLMMVFFAVELGAVYGYFFLSGRRGKKQLDSYLKSRDSLGKQ
mgnify:CR=1 FL=1